MPFGHALLDEFLLDPTFAYLNHGGYGVTPRAVLAAQRQWQEALEREPTRFQETERADALDAALRRVAPFVGASPRDLVFVHNATTAANAVLFSLALRPEDEVVVLDHGYPSVRRAAGVWAERAGARVVTAALPQPLVDSGQVVDALRDALGPRTRLVIVDHVTSATALILPVARIAAMCRERGVPVFVDGAHAPGHLALDIEALRVDFYTGNLHKWAFAPKTCAVLWAAPQHQETLRHPVVSYAADTWRGAFHWPGTNDPSAWLASTAALDFLDHLGPAAVRAHNHDLADAAAEALSARWGTDRPFPRAMHGAMVALHPPGTPDATPETVQRLRASLRDERIEVPIFAHSGRLWVRIAAQVYNEPDDYDRLGEALERLLA